MTFAEQQSDFHPRVSSPDHVSKQARVLAKGLVRLLHEHWQLSREQQCELLGLSPQSRRKLVEMAEGLAELPKGRDAADRAGYLLAIHKALGLLYPANPELRYGWVKLFNQELQCVPLQMMLNDGILGLAKVSRYLDFVRGR
jgi:hypothetical protein